MATPAGTITADTGSVPDAAEIDAIDHPDAAELEAWIARETGQAHRTPEASERLWACQRAARRLADPEARRRVYRAAQAAWRRT